MTSIHANPISLVVALLAASTCVAAPDREKANVQLFKAVYGGDLAQVRRALSRGADANARDEQGDTPLMVHTQTQWFEAGDTRIVQALLRAGARVDERDAKSTTPLMLASQLDWDEVVRMLLHRGADVEARDSQGRTPLMHAALGSVVHESSTHCSSPESVRLLLRRGARVNARDKSGQTALVWAAKTEVDDMMPAGGARDYHRIALRSARLLLSRGANPRLASNNGNTALKWAKLRCHTEMAKLLERRAC